MVASYQLWYFNRTKTDKAHHAFSVVESRFIHHPSYQLTMCGNLSFSFRKVFAYNLLGAYIKNYINDHNKIYVCIPIIVFDKTMSWRLSRC